MNANLMKMKNWRPTGIGRETIRYYIREGLLPERCGQRNVATYGREHVKQLNLIRRLRERHLPLSVGPS